MPCHSPAQHAGGLVLDSLAGINKGGNSGALFTSGNPDQSILLIRLTSDKAGPRMPMGFKPLGSEDMRTIRAWIAGGGSMAPEKTDHWAFIPPVKPAIPKVKDSKWATNPIDDFILAKLEKEGFAPSPQADKTTLIRRVTLDLTGLPPTPQEVDAFIADRSPQAYGKLVDRLLASPHFGERMALPWLDAARYADSNGFQQDGDTYQYIWRDWVVRAYNQNMPFDQFTIEQLAGDLLPKPTRDQLIATAFNRNHMLNGEGGAIPEEQRNVILFDRVDTTATTWLGLTMACARCHDHKYDPLTQRDFYSFMAFFNNVPESGVPSGSGQYRIADPWIYVTTPKQEAEAYQLEAKLKTATPEEKKTLAPQIAELKEQWPRVMVMSDRQPRKTHWYFRGNYEEPRDEVKPDTPHSLPKALPTSNRLGLAKWIVSPKNPLASRVAVNRLWQTFFGHGLVRTEENFGVKGEPPTHPELLDWLAVDFRESGWNVKRMVRMIVTSSTYRQSSKVSPKLLERDPANRFYARGARFRLLSMLLRDVALASSGLLDPKIGGKPVYPYQPKGIWDGLTITLERDFSYPQSKGADNFRRSIYTFWRRTAAPGNMFDSANRQVCTVKQSATSTPLHALTMLNDVTWVETARHLAQNVMPANDDSARLREAFRRVCARRPTAKELDVLLRALNRSRTAFIARPADAEAFLSGGESKPPTGINSVELASLSSVCLAIYNLDEAMTRE
ncbi:MAG TPA: PSD1 and planctomycete cytochrome C domain-containing protein [Fimbriimonadaceae bacterium]|nr:PSD1 and planctomycete cytochrome C domain-containing protein [Fimbriimonadaceae bacterium]